MWAPHLWIPYSLMGAGLTLITAEYVVQVVDAIAGRTAARHARES